MDIYEYAYFSVKQPQNYLLYLLSYYRNEFIF